MNESNSNRWFLLSGILFAVLWAVAGALSSGGIEFMPEAGSLADYLRSNSERLWFIGYLGTLAAFFLLWFSGSVSGVLKRAGESSLADIALGGGGAAGAVVAVANSGIGALAERAGSAAGISPEAAVVFYDSLGFLNGIALPITFAAFSGAVGLAIVRTQLLPAWFGWLSVILAIALLTPVAYYAFAAMLLWVLVLTVWLFIRMGREAVDEMAGLESSGA